MAISENHHIPSFKVDKWDHLSFWMVITHYDSAEAIALGNRVLIVRALLDSEKAKGIKPAADPSAESELEGLLAIHVRDLADRMNRVIRFDTDGAYCETFDVTSNVDGVPAIDEALAAHVEKIGPDGSRLAAAVRENGKVRLAKVKGGSANTESLWSAWRIVDKHPKAITGLAYSLWLDIVKPKIEALRKPARLATDIAKAFSMGRASGGDTLESDREQLIMVKPPQGMALTLPFDADMIVSAGTGLVGLRQVLSPRTFRTYFATNILWFDNGMDADGSFPYEGPESILDLTSSTKHLETKGARQYSRYASKDRRSVEDDIALLSRIRVHAVGELQAAAGDALVDEIRARRTGKTVTLAHARLVAADLKKRYIQIPRAACRLPLPDVPLGIGVAMLIRANINGYLRSQKSISAPIREWLLAGGEVADVGARRDGTRFWPDTTERLSRIAEDAELGTFRAVGQGRETILTLEPAEGLKAAYAPLLVSSLVHLKAHRQARIADKRATAGR